MTQPNSSTAAARAIIDELVRGGVRFGVVSPGSRSAALAIAADQHPDLMVRVALDERSAAFHALGHAKAHRAPALVICTSGTAGANYYPAVIEASMACAPLVLLTADRPAELRGVGANQTIDQRRLYGEHVRFFEEIPAPDPGVDGNRLWRTAAAEAVGCARGVAGPPGPVHLNVAFREPTVPVSDDGRTQVEPYPFPIDGRVGSGPWLEQSVEPPGSAGVPLDTARRGLVVAGDGDYDRAGLVAAAGRMGWPVLATAESGLRGSGGLGSYHHILASPAGTLAPEIVYAVGSVGPSRRLEALIDNTPLQYRIDAWGRNLNPGLGATEVLQGDPVTTLAAQDGDPASSWWGEGWTDAEKRVAAAIATATAELPTSGPGVVSALNEASWDTLVVASSLPIRDVDAHLRRPGRVIANRGASGIDGLVSTALGAARGSTVALTGDLSLLHDSNGFLVDEPGNVVFVVVDNGGGGLFDLLPAATHAPGYERLFVHPPHRDFADLARLHRLEYTRVESVEGLRIDIEEGLERGGLHLVHVVVDRETDLQVRARLDEISRSARGR